MVIIGASQALDPGSIPGERIGRGIGAIGSARALQARGTGIETPMLHWSFLFFRLTFNIRRVVFLCLYFLFYERFFFLSL